MMKVFQIITRADTIGGAQKHVLDVSKKLKQEGHQVTIVSGASSVFNACVIKEGMEFVEMNCFKRELSFFDDLKTLFCLLRLFCIHRPDIIAVHSTKAGLLGRISGFLSCSNVYFTAHGWSHIRDASGLKKIIYSNLEHFLSFLCLKVICVSQADIDFAHQVIGIKQHRLCLIENGVHPVQVNPKRKERTKGVIHLLSVVRLQAPKDFETLLLGLSKIKHRSWRLNILGDGPDIQLVKERIRALNLQDKVSLLGFKDNIEEYYQIADVVVLISRSEGLPMSLLEAMSCHKLLIASDVGGISDLIIHEWNGFLIPPNTPSYLTSCLLKVIESPSLIEEYGHNSKKHFDLNYRFEHMYSKTLALYKEALV